MAIGIKAVLVVVAAVIVGVIAVGVVVVGVVEVVIVVHENRTVVVARVVPIVLEILVGVRKGSRGVARQRISEYKFILK